MNKELNRKQRRALGKGISTLLSPREAPTAVVSQVAAAAAPPALNGRNTSKISRISRLNNYAQTKNSRERCSMRRSLRN